MVQLLMPFSYHFSKCDRESELVAARSCPARATFCDRQTLHKTRARSTVFFRDVELYVMRRTSIASVFLDRTVDRIGRKVLQQDPYHVNGSSYSRQNMPKSTLLILSCVRTSGNKKKTETTTNQLSKNSKRAGFFTTVHKPTYSH